MNTLTSTVNVQPAEEADNTDERSLWIAPDRRELFARNGVQRVDDLDHVEAVHRFEKTGLPPWRRRFAIELCDAAGAAQRLYVKRFLHPPVRTQLRRILSGHLRRSTAGVERYWIRRVGDAGISVPRAAAFADDLRGGWERDSALVLSEAPGESLERWARRGRRASTAWVQELARFVARLHAAGFVHRDLYLCHIFVDGVEDRRPRFCLIDLQRVMHTPLRRKRWIAREIAQLHYSTPASAVRPRDRLRWLKCYLGARWDNKRWRRAMIRRVLRKAAAIRAHDMRRRGMSEGQTA